MTEVIKKIKSIFLSPKSALISLFLVLAACLVSVIVPQLSNARPAYFATVAATSPMIYYLLNLLQLNHVYTSGWFFALILFLVLILLFSLGRQYQKARAAYAGGVVPLLSTPQLELTVAGEALHSLKRSLRNKGFRVEEQEAGEGCSLRFRKNRMSLWGNFLFHVGLLLLILASLLSFAFQKWGFVQLIEGDTFSGQEANFLTLDKGIFAGEFNVKAEVSLASFRHIYWDTGELKELASEVVIHRPEAPLRKVTITKATPQFIKDVRLYQSGHFGYAVKIELLKERQVIPGYYLLDMLARGKPLTGRSDFPMTGYDVDLKLYPDMKGRGIYSVDPLLSIIF
ncbi:MAG: cytochrome c biogenesis protein ResB, partial [Syntrophales bacterium]